MNKDYISNQNSYEGNIPLWIVVHNTDNFNTGANAKAHAKAQHDGNFSGMSAHVYTDDSDKAYQAMPFDRGAWHVGVNYGGKLFGTVNNRNSIGVEMCVQSGYDYEKAFSNTVAVVKQLMEELNIDADHVVSHYDVCGKNCPSQIRAKGDWERFKKLIGAESAELPEASGEVVVDKLYRVRKSWENSTSQLGAYYSLDNAKSVCGIGYKVYDWNGEIVYENDTETTGTQTVEFANLTEEQAAAKLLEICRPIAEKYGLLPSVCAAQTILESGYCKTELAKAANNVCGMKCELSGNTWEGSTWNGSSKVRIKTAEQDPAGNVYYIYDDFRKYQNIEDSIADRCAYLLGAKNGDDLRYVGITTIGNYKAQITVIKAGGYATDVNYVSKICSIIERFDLDKYDGEVTATTPEPVMKYFVRKSWKDSKSQLGAYIELQNAKDKVNENWQWNVYDSTGTEIYNGAKALVDRAVDWMVGIANDNDHGYTNGKWGPEYSCISLVEKGFINAGLNIKKSNIDKMPENLIKAGLEECTNEVNLNNGKGFAKGYIPWMLKPNSRHGHVECFIGDGKLVGARGDTDGKAGDSKGNEISIIPYQNMSWQKVFRLPGAYTGEESSSKAEEAGTICRVQAGAYSSETNAKNALKKVRAAGYADAFIKIEDGMRKIQAWAGSRAGAEKAVADLQGKGINAIIKD